MHKLFKIILPTVLVAALVGGAVYMINRSDSNGQEGKMQTVTSKDGTKIAYDKSGEGPAVILVNGALSTRSAYAELAQLLSDHFTVYNYDRRGRGDSGDTKPYSVEREIEDIEALIAEAGGSAYVHGTSSGAALALQAAAALGDKVKKLTVYEAPYSEEAGAAEQWKQYRAQLSELLAANRHEEAVAMQMKIAGVPDAAVAQMKSSSTWPAMVEIAPTLAYDVDVLGIDRSVPVADIAKIKADTLAMDGGANAQTMPFMRSTAEKIAATVPNAQHRTIEGQMHNVDAKVIAPVLIQFFAS